MAIGNGLPITYAGGGVARYRRPTPKIAHSQTDLQNDWAEYYSTTPSIDCWTIAGSTSMGLALHSYTSSVDIEGLSSHHQALLEEIEVEERIAPGDLYEKYRRNVENPKSERTIRNYLRKLERYDLISAEGSARNRVSSSLRVSNRDLKTK